MADHSYRRVDGRDSIPSPIKMLALSLLVTFCPIFVASQGQLMSYWSEKSPADVVLRREKRMAELLLLGGLIGGGGIYARRQYKQNLRRKRLRRLGYRPSSSSRYKPKRRRGPPNANYYKNRKKGKSGSAYYANANGYLPPDLERKLERERRRKMERRSGREPIGNSEALQNDGEWDDDGEAENEQGDENLIPSDPAYVGDQNGQSFVQPGPDQSGHPVPNDGSGGGQGYFQSTMGAVGKFASGASGFAQPFVKNVAPTVLKTGLTAAGTAVGAFGGPLGMAAAGYATNALYDNLTNRFLSPQPNSGSANPPP